MTHFSCALLSNYPRAINDLARWACGIALSSHFQVERQIFAWNMKRVCRSFSKESLRDHLLRELLSSVRFFKSPVNRRYLVRCSNLTQLQGSKAIFSEMRKPALNPLHGRLARWIKWRACDVGEAKEGLESELWRRWSNGTVVKLAVTYLRKATEGLDNALWRRWSDGKVGEWALLIQSGTWAARQVN